MQTRAPAWLADVGSHDLEPRHQSARNAIREAGFTGVLALPVLAGNRVPAVLEFFMKQRAEPDAGLVEILGSIGVQLGRVFEREHAQATQEQQARTIEALAITDELTGLLNRRGFVMQALQQVKVCRRRNERCLLFFMDMDGLKRINDQLGHAAGDAALQDVAVVLRCSFRDADLVARLGGDEFVALAQSDQTDLATTLTERIQVNLRGRFANENPAYPLAISTGLRWVEPIETLSIEELLVEADSAMYEAKKQRRAREPDRALVVG
jgi:diguanylate cyclase (GGDEF)-like protein